MKDPSTSNGNCTIPPDATAVAMNVTAVNGTAGSFLTIWPSDIARPLASSLNWVPGSPPTPNKVDVKLSGNGMIGMFNNAGSVDLLADVVGYYQDHNHDDRYYTKAQIDAKVPASRSITISGSAFVGVSSTTPVDTDANYCRSIVAPPPSAWSLAASIELPVGATITKIVVMLQDGDGLGNSVAALLVRRTLGSETELTEVHTIGVVNGAYNLSATLVPPEPVTSGRYYTIAYSQTIATPDLSDAVCGAEVFYTEPG
jgi:hypothetical protein